MHRRNRVQTGLVIGLGLSALFVGRAWGGVLFVDASASKGGNGRSWARAFNRLDDALRIAIAGDEIWVATGIYRPAPADGDRTVSFRLIDGVAVYGGFAGDERRRRDRDWVRHPVILSGDLNQDDGAGGSTVENSYHVVDASGVGPATVLDGLTIADGNANGPYPMYFGGGVLARFGSPTLLHCTFLRNTAIVGGGLAADDSDLILSDCLFSGNSADFGGGAFLAVAGRPMLRRCTFSDNDAQNGAGLYYTDGAAPRVIDCRFEDNSASNLAGGMFAGRGAGVAINSVFLGNTARFGGGVGTSSGSLTLVNCLIASNRAVGNGTGTGGGVYSFSSASTLINCTLTENRADTGGGLAGLTSDPTLVSSIFWANRDSDGETQGSQIRVLLGELGINYSCVQGWDGSLGGTGNIGDDPQLSRDGAFRPRAGSPCVDAADSGALPPDTDDLDGDGDLDEPIPLDLDGRVRRLDDPGTDDTGQGPPPVVDMGPYELHCTGREKVSANCVDDGGGGRIKAVARRGQPGASLTFFLDDGASPRVETVDPAGRAKTRWKGVAPGPHTVTVANTCGRSREASVDCP